MAQEGSAIVEQLEIEMKLPACNHKSKTFMTQSLSILPEGAPFQRFQEKPGLCYRALRRRHRELRTVWRWRCSKKTPRWEVELKYLESMGFEVQKPGESDIEDW
jgi:hypothetical protein